MAFVLVLGKSTVRSFFGHSLVNDLVYFEICVRLFAFYPVLLCVCICYVSCICRFMPFIGSQNFPAVGALNAVTLPLTRFVPSGFDKQMLELLFYFSMSFNL